MLRTRHNAGAPGAFCAGLPHYWASPNNSPGCGLGLWDHALTPYAKGFLRYKHYLIAVRICRGFPCLKLPMFSTSLFSEYILRVKRSFLLYPAFQSLLTANAVCTSQLRYWRRSHAHSDPTCMTVAWPNGGDYGVFPAVEVDTVDTEVPRVQPVQVDGVLKLKEQLSKMPATAPLTIDPTPYGMTTGRQRALALHLCH